MEEESAPKLSVFINVGATDWDPAECTIAVGLEATHVWRQPDRLVSGGRRKSEWSHGFEKRASYSVDDAVSSLLDEIWDHAGRIRSFGKREGFSLSVTCTVTIKGDRPEYSLRRETLKKLAWLGCSFCLDILDYSA
jgi:hypothetical protein